LALEERVQHGALQYHRTPGHQRQRRVLRGTSRRSDGRRQPLAG